MPYQTEKRYRIGVRPASSNRSRYLWTICGTQKLFYEVSQTEHASVDDALAEANARLSQLS